MEELISTMADFAVGPNCNPEQCSNFDGCPALRLGQKLHAIATSEIDVRASLSHGIYDWHTSATHIGERVGQLNIAALTCTGWERAGKKAFEASSLSTSVGGFGKSLVLVDVVTSQAATRVGLPKGTVFLEQPMPMSPEDREDREDSDCSRGIR